jgi:plasmid maintenance system antidote protein VapI
MQIQKAQTTFKPAIVFSPGSILSDELDALGVTIQDLPETLIDVVPLIIEEKQKITPEIADQLAIFLETSSQFWLNLEENYQDFLVRKAKGLSPHVETLYNQICSD